MITNLQSIRYDAGYTMRELGAEIGCTYGAVYAWEHGKAWPLPGVGKRLKEFFGLPLDVLLAPRPSTTKRRPPREETTF